MDQALGQGEPLTGNHCSGSGQSRLRLNPGRAWGMELVDLRDTKEVEATGLSAHKHRLSAPHPHFLPCWWGG